MMSKMFIEDETIYNLYQGVEKQLINPEQLSLSI